MEPEPSMSPVVLAAIITSIVSLIGVTFSLFVTFLMSHHAKKTSAAALELADESKTVLLRCENAMLNFEKTFVDRLNGRYIRLELFEKHEDIDREHHTQMADEVKRLREHYHDSLTPTMAALALKVAKLEVESKLLP